MSNKIHDITRQAGQAKNIIVYLVSGREVEGSISAIGPDWIEVGNRRIYESFLAGWEVVDELQNGKQPLNDEWPNTKQKPNLEPLQTAVGSGETKPTNQRPSNAGEQEIGHVTISQNTSARNDDIGSEMSRLAIEFLSAMKYARLEPPKFEREIAAGSLNDMNTSDALTFRNTWVRAVNICENAYKLKDFQKLKRAIEVFDTMEKTPQDFEHVDINITVLYLQLGQPKKALERIETRLRQAPSAKLFSCAAYYATETANDGKALYYLSKYCMQERANIHDSEFYCMLHYVHESSAFQAFNQMLEWATSHGCSDKIAKALLEAIAVLLWQRNFHDDAKRVLEISNSESSITAIHDVVEHILEKHIDNTPNIWTQTQSALAKEELAWKDSQIVEAWTAREAELREKALLAPNGVIHAYYTDRAFGFLTDKHGVQRYFNRGSVRSNQLIAILDSFRNGTKISVCCKLS